MWRILSPRLRALGAGALLVLSAPAVAQITVTPNVVAVSLAEGETAEAVLVVSYAELDSAGFALSLAPTTKLEEPPGTVLFTSEDTCCSFDDLTTTPDGRLFVSTNLDTYEFTSELEFVREFRHPLTQLITATVGVTHDADRETLWWLDVQTGDFNVTEQALLLEGDFDGEETGERLPAFWDADPSACGNPSGRPNALTYDAVTTAETTGGTGYFYYLDLGHDTIWALDTLGQAVEGYPVAQTDYAGIPQPLSPEGCLINESLDAHALGGEPVLEIVTGYPFRHPRNRAYTVVVTDRWGRNRGAETPLFNLPTPDGFGEVVELEGVVRSRLDPSVLYLTVATEFNGDFRDFVYAVRAAPLPPPWLHGSPILFGVEGESQTELLLSLDATGLEPGVYEAVASVREGDGIGPVLVDVPVTLTVAPVDSEDEAAEPEPFALDEPYPNPSDAMVTVPLVLGTAAEVRVAVFDVLGREVMRLAEGRLEAGRHRLTLDSASLPAGVYLIRASGEGFALTERLTVIRED